MWSNMDKRALIQMVSEHHEMSKFRLGKYFGSMDTVTDIDNPNYQPPVTRSQIKKTPRKHSNKSKDVIENDSMQHVVEDVGPKNDTSPIVSKVRKTNTSDVKGQPELEITNKSAQSSISISKQSTVKNKSILKEASTKSGNTSINKRVSINNDILTLEAGPLKKKKKVQSKKTPVVTSNHITADTDPGDVSNIKPNQSVNKSKTKSPKVPYRTYVSGDTSLNKRVSMNIDISTQETGSLTKKKKVQSKKKTTVSPNSITEKNEPANVSDIKPNQTLNKHGTKTPKDPYKTHVFEKVNALISPVVFKGDFVMRFEDKLLKERADLKSLLPKPIIKEILIKYNKRNEKHCSKVQLEADLKHFLHSNCSYENKPKSSREFWEASLKNMKFSPPVDCPVALSATQSQYKKYNNLVTKITETKGTLVELHTVIDNAVEFKRLTNTARKAVRKEKDTLQLDLTKQRNVIENALTMKKDALELIERFFKE